MPPAVAAVASVLGSVGVSAALATTIATGVVTGAAVGAVSAAISGGNILEGALKGGLMGGVFAGVGSAVSSAMSSATPISEAAVQGVNSATAVEGVAAASNTAVPVAQSVAPGAAQAVQTTVAPATQGGLLLQPTQTLSTMGSQGASSALSTPVGDTALSNAQMMKAITDGQTQSANIMAAAQKDIANRTMYSTMGSGLLQAAASGISAKQQQDLADAQRNRVGTPVPTLSYKGRIA